MNYTEQAREIVASLTVDEKIRLLNGQGSWYTFTADGKIPRLTMSDGPHGLRVQSENESYANINDSKKATCFPSASCIASSWNRSTVRAEAVAIAQEAKAEHVDIMLGCGMNIKRSPLCGRNFEYFSEDPLLSGELAASYVDGMQSEGVAACIKHFACNNQETNRQSSSSTVDERTLREIYLRGFETAVTEVHPYAIMTSYNMVNGTYASENAHLIKDLLRNQWKFDGIVISDWGADMDSPHSVKAGLDIAMPDSFGYFQKKLSDAVLSGELTEKDIDAPCERIVQMALKLSDAAKKNGTVSVSYEAQHKTALLLAEDSAVLLKNDGVLPLKLASSKQTVIVIGSLAKYPRFQGGGSSHINATCSPSILSELEKECTVIYADGYYADFCPEKKRAKKNAPLMQQALKVLDSALSEHADATVLFVSGLTDCFEGEGFDRADMKLPSEQVELYQAVSKRTQNIIAVNISGSPVDLSCMQSARAVLQLYLAGQASGTACVNLLTGKVNPSGHLAETWPDVSHLSPSVFISKEKYVPYKEGVLTGYRYYETENLPVQYEFGFGLSYTTFELSDFSVSQQEKNTTVTVTVKNTGLVDGAQVVQVYVNNPLEEGYVRPFIELAAFEKVYLKKGESKQISLTLDDKAFCVFSTKQNQFETVQGTYSVACGFSVRDLRCQKEISVKGKMLPELIDSETERLQKLSAMIPEQKDTLLTACDSMQTLSQYSLFARIFLRLVEFVIIATSESKSAEDPVVKISLQAIRENPVESLISTSGGIITPKLVKRLVRSANKKR